MSFKIGKAGIASIDFEISLDRNSTKVVMMQPYQSNLEFYKERLLIGNIVKASIFSSNSVVLTYGSYSDKTFSQLKESVDILRENFIIDVRCHDVMIKTLGERVAQVKIESEKEVARFATHFADFNTNVASLYKGLSENDDLISLSENKILIDESIVQLDYLISDVCRYRGSPMKVGMRWVYLFLSEGALEHLIKSLNKEEHKKSKDRLESLHRGVSCFLKEYEVELHLAVEKEITSSAEWFQELYAAYKSMVKRGQSPSNDQRNQFRLVLPSRFVKF